MGFRTKLSLFVAVIAVSAPLIWIYKDQREFNNRTTADKAANAMDLKGKVVIVTGANTGIGKPTARVLADRGATVIMACRNIQKANAAKDDIIKLLSEKTEHKSSDLDQKINIIKLDLNSLKSVDEFSREFQSKYDRLDYLINNAGINQPEWISTEDGIESMFGVNHIGHFRLTMDLTPLLIKSATPTSIARVISLSSWGQLFSQSPLSDWFNNDTLIQSKDAFDSMKNYGLSKVANILFANEYNERYKDQNVYAVSLHPGAIPTELTRYHGGILHYVWNYIFGPIILKTREQGAATTIRTISMTEEEFKRNGGAYFSDCNPAMQDLRDDIFPTNVEKDKMPQTLMWKLTESMIKKYYK